MKNCIKLRLTVCVNPLSDPSAKLPLLFLALVVEMYHRFISETRLLNAMLAPLYGVSQNTTLIKRTVSQPPAVCFLFF